MRFPPASVIASWPKANYVNPERRGNALLVIETVLSVISTTFVALRLYARLRGLRTLGADDVLIVLAWASGLALTGCVCAAVQQWGWDLHVWDVPASDAVPSRLISLVSQIIYLLSSCLTKASLLVFYRRILVSKKDLWAINGTLIFVGMYYVAFTIVLFVQCRPLSYYWLLLVPGSKGTCVNEPAHLVTSTTINVVIDFVILIIPMRTILALRINLVQKLQVIALLTAGGLVVVASIIKVYYVNLVQNETFDVTWEGYLLWLFTALEIHIGLICASVPACQSLLSSWTTRLKTQTGGSNSRSHNKSLTTGKINSYNYIDEDDVAASNARRRETAKLGDRSQGSQGDSTDDLFPDPKGVAVELQQMEDAIRKPVERRTGNNTTKIWSD